MPPMHRLPAVSRSHSSKSLAGEQRTITNQSPKPMTTSSQSAVCEGSTSAVDTESSTDRHHYPGANADGAAWASSLANTCPRSARRC